MEGTGERTRVALALEMLGLSRGGASCIAEGRSLTGRPPVRATAHRHPIGLTNAPWLANAIQTQQDKLVGLGIHLPLPAIMDVRAQVRPSASEDPSDVPALRPAEWSRRHCCGYLSALVICASCSVSAPRATYPAHSTSQLLPYSTGLPYATETALCFLQLPLHWHPPERAAARAKGVSASRLAFGQQAPLSRDVMFRTRSPN